MCVGDGRREVIEMEVGEDKKCKKKKKKKLSLSLTCPPPFAGLRLVLPCGHLIPGCALRCRVRVGRLIPGAAVGDVGHTAGGRKRIVFARAAAAATGAGGAAGHWVGGWVDVYGVGVERERERERGCASSLSPACARERQRECGGLFAFSTPAFSRLIPPKPLLPPKKKNTMDDDAFADPIPALTIDDPLATTMEAEEAAAPAPAPVAAEPTPPPPPPPPPAPPASVVEAAPAPKPAAKKAATPKAKSTPKATPPPASARPGRARKTVEFFSPAEVKQTEKLVVVQVRGRGGGGCERSAPMPGG